MIRLWTGMLAAIAVLGACAESTPYKPAGEGSRYGYSEQRIETNRYMVRFSGNTLTDRSTVETYLLFRAAELTLQQGHDYFRVVRRETEEESRYVGDDPFGYGYHSRFHVRYRYFHPHYGWYGAYSPYYDRVHVREIDRYEASAEIIIGVGPHPDDPDVFNANEVVANLQDEVVRPEEQDGAGTGY